MQEFLKDIGIAGFLFFLIKGILWLVLFALVYFGLVDKKKIIAFKEKISFWKKKKKL
ncbi:hypothetical protein [Aquimarina longa]|uniref:hypothetical protein n=1 Tax=Aquimarina longa TaxID=1080221 RepID=UPI000A490475|nr:hypothetical protein [Aquimarina longa]